MELMHIGKAIEKRRVALHLLQDGLGGFSASHISMIERGERRPSHAALVAIAKDLGTEAWILMREASKGRG